MAVELDQILTCETVWTPQNAEPAPHPGARRQNANSQLTEASDEPTASVPLSDDARISIRFRARDPQITATPARPCPEDRAIIVSISSETVTLADPMFHVKQTLVVHGLEEVIVRFRLTQFIQQEVYGVCRTHWIQNAAQDIDLRTGGPSA